MKQTHLNVGPTWWPTVFLYHHRKHHGLAVEIIDAKFVETEFQVDVSYVTWICQNLHGKVTCGTCIALYIRDVLKPVILKTEQASSFFWSRRHASLHDLCCRHKHDNVRQHSKNWAGSSHILFWCFGPKGVVGTAPPAVSWSRKRGDSWADGHSNKAISLLISSRFTCPHFLVQNQFECMICYDI